MKRFRLSIIGCIAVLVISGCASTKPVELPPLPGTSKAYMEQWDALEAKHGAPSEEFRYLYGRLLIDYIRMESEYKKEGIE